MNTTTLKKPARRDRAAQREETRSSILAAATELFAKHGFEGTPIPAIAKQSGARNSLIFYHFETKDALWKACVDGVFAEVNAYIDAREAALDDMQGLDYFREAVAIHIGAAAAVPAYHRILFREAMHESDRLRWLVEKHQRPLSDRIIQVIEKAQASGILPATLDPMHLKFLTSGLFTLPITLAPEYRLMTGTDPLDQHFVSKHIDACLSLLLKK